MRTQRTDRKKVWRKEIHGDLNFDARARKRGRAVFRMFERRKGRLKKHSGKGLW